MLAWEFSPQGRLKTLFHTAYHKSGCIFPLLEWSNYQQVHSSLISFFPHTTPSLMRCCWEFSPQRRLKTLFLTAYHKFWYWAATLELSNYRQVPLARLNFPHTTPLLMGCCWEFQLKRLIKQDFKQHIIKFCVL